MDPLISTEIVRIDERRTDAYLSINPTITDGSICIHGNSVIYPIRIEIINLAGKIIFTKQIPDNRIDVNNLPSGFYFLKIEMETGMETKRFIKL